MGLNSIPPAQAERGAAKRKRDGGAMIWSAVYGKGSLAEGKADERPRIDLAVSQVIEAAKEAAKGEP